MKKLILLAGVAGALLFAACSGSASDERITLVSERDTLSYSAGMYSARNLSLMVEELGINSATMDFFIAGVRDAYPLEITPETKAYAYGLSLGAATMDMREKAGKVVNVDTDGIDTRLFLEGIIAAVCGNNETLDLDSAVEYCYVKRYRVKSEEFMERNKKRPAVTTLPSGLQYKIETPGKGVVAEEGDTVGCIYKGSLVNGDVVETSGTDVVDFPVSDLIPGLGEALTLLPEGTRCTLYLPWELAYGVHGTDGVPPYSAIVFDLEIVKVYKNRQQAR